MAISFVQAAGTGADAAGWNQTLSGVTGGSSLIFQGSGILGGSPSFTSIATADALTVAINTGTGASHGGGQADFFIVAYKHGATATDHTVAATDSNISHTESVLYEVAGLASAAAEATNTSTATATSSHPSGAVSTAGNALLVAMMSHDGAGVETYDTAGWTQEINSSRDIQGSRITAGGAGSYEGDVTTSSTGNSGSVIAAFAEAGGASTWPHGPLGHPLYGALAGPIGP